MQGGVIFEACSEQFALAAQLLKFLQRGVECRIILLSKPR
jgi:hypothetical protein